MNSNEYNKWYLIVAVFAIIFTFFGGTLAYWQWNTNESERTSIALTVKEDFRCDVDGGGDITSEEKYLVPTDCTNNDYAIQRTITVNPKLFTNDLNINYQLQLKINSIDTGLRNSKNFKYALTTNPNSCTTGVIESGTFYGLSANKTVDIFKNIYTSTRTENYYLYIWLDKAETSTSTMDQKFSLSLTGSCTNDPSVEPEKPVLDSGMIPVTISNTGVVTTISEDDENWYDYSDKKWANVVLVNENATSGVSGSKSRQYYKNNPGTTVAEDDILAYYVWIPRYKYKAELINVITLSEEDKNELSDAVYMIMTENGEECTEEQARAVVDDAIETGIVTLSINGEIQSLPFADAVDLAENLFNIEIEIIENEDKRFDVVFEAKASPISRGDAVSTYYTHPAFVWDGKNVGGIWVGKFETTGAVEKPTILPNLLTLKVNYVREGFETSLKFAGGTLLDGIVTFNGNSAYGLTNNVDSHMMKNSEWGVVAYLVYSKFGANQEIFLNNSLVSGLGISYTGRSSGFALGDGGEYTELFNRYGTYTWIGQEVSSDGIIGDVIYSKLGTNASTTGNITGIYDMAGGNIEYVMGVLSDSNGNPRSGLDLNWNSGFNGVVFDSSTEILYTSGIAFPESKYYDLYLNSQFSGDRITNFDFCTLETCGGHALYETKELSTFNLTFNGSEQESLPWFIFDSHPWFIRGNLIIFGSSYDAGNGYDNPNSFRSVLIVD